MPEYINLRNHQVYNYEWDHEGEAVVLLHGGLSKTSSWDYIMVPHLKMIFMSLHMIEQHMVSLVINLEVCILNFRHRKQLLIWKMLLKSQRI